MPGKLRDWQGYLGIVRRALAAARRDNVEQLRLDRESPLNRLGNLTLVTQPLECFLAQLTNQPGQ
jgi:hypothetical protein